MGHPVGGAAEKVAPPSKMMIFSTYLVSREIKKIMFDFDLTGFFI
jgi:hypothetical protein